MIQQHPFSAGRYVLPLAFAFSVLAACSEDNSATQSNTDQTETVQTVDLSDGSSMYFDRDVRIPMRDGITLSANIFRPTEDGDYPVLLAMTPYNKDALPMDEDEVEVGVDVSEYAAFEQPDPDFWVPHGYVVVAVDTRGMNKSEGDMALFTDQEANDYYDAIEWLALQPWSNGRVGLNGVSYMAINQWKVAQLHPPHLHAIMPWEGFTDLYRDASYHGGIADTGFITPWWQFRILENANETSADQDLAGRITNTPLDGELYQSLSPTALETITVPAYVAASWPDHGLHTRGTLLGFEAISSPHKWLEVHGRQKLEWYYSE